MWVWVWRGYLHDSNGERCGKVMKVTFCCWLKCEEGRKEKSSNRKSLKHSMVFACGFWISDKGYLKVESPATTDHSVTHQPYNAIVGTLQ